MSAALRQLEPNVKLPELEQARARAAAALATLAHNVFVEQATVDAANGATTAVIGPTALFKPVDPSGITVIEANVTGLGKTGMTSATAQIEFSVDGGATWTPVQTQPIPGTNAAGALAADTEMGSSLLFRFTNSAIPAGAEFRVSVTPAGAHFQTTVNQGSMLVYEV